MKSIFGGVFISIGTFAYLITLQKTGNVFLASITFYLGLSLIILLCQNLFTGQVLSKATESIDDYIGMLFTTWIFNFVGAIITTLLLSQILHPDVTQIVTTKLSQSYPQIIISGIFCNMLVCSAVASFFAYENHFLSCFFVTCFVLLGFEHSIADMTYFTLAYINGINTNIPQLLICILLASLGNIIGGRLVYEAVKLGGRK